MEQISEGFLLSTAADQADILLYALAIVLVNCWVWVVLETNAMWPGPVLTDDVLPGSCLAYFVKQCL